MNPAVSVITPTKNRLTHLGEALNSVQTQSLDEWEHIVVDDGSDDGTTEELSRRSAEDPRVRYIRRSGEKTGANVCRNLGIQESRAPFLVFLDSDDLLQSDCLAKRVEVMKRNADIDFATFQTGIFKERIGDLGRQLDPELTGDDLLRFLFFECPWIITAPIWRRHSLDRLGGFDEALPSWQDVELHIRAIASGSRYLRFPQIDHHVRWQSEPTKVSIEQRCSPRHLEAAMETLQKIERHIVDGPGISWTRQRALCSLYFFIAECWTDVGQVASALRCWGQIRHRNLGSASLHAVGSSLLLLKAMDGRSCRFGTLIAHKWKGWARMRTNPELVTP